jgi:hypothetical protein
VSPSQKLVSQNDQFTVDIALSAVDQPSNAASAQVNFDPAILTCTSIEEGTFYSSWAGDHGGSTLFLPAGQCDNTNGTTGALGDTILLSFTGPQPVHSGGPTGGGVVWTIHFTAKANGVSAIHLTKVELEADYVAPSRPLQAAVDDGQVFVGVTPTATPQGGPTPTNTATLIPAEATQAAATQAAGGGSGTPGGYPGPGGSGTTGAGQSTPGQGPTLPPEQASQAASTAQSINATAPPPPGTVVPTVPVPITGTNAGGVAAGFDLSTQINASGILSNDVALVSPDHFCGSSLARDTQALTADNLPLRVVTIDHLGHPVTATVPLISGAQCEFGPPGANFDPPITITLAYSPSALPKGTDPNHLLISYYDAAGNKWVDLPSRVNTNGHFVTARVSHFSLYALRPGAVQPAWLPWLVASIVLEVILGGGLAWYLYRRRRKQAPAFSPPWGDVKLLPAPVVTGEPERAASGQAATD